MVHNTKVSFQIIVFQQLGMMVIAIGLSSYNIALFHLVNHAYMLYKCM